MYTVYFTYNKIYPTKAYVGMTKKDTAGYKGSGTYLAKAIKKYGIDNFIRTDLGKYLYEDECHYWEGFYIRTLKTHISQGGYNLSWTGGTNYIKGHKHTDISKQKMSLSRRNKPTWNKGLKGVQKAWNKGLTKETDESVRRYSETKIGHIVSEDIRRKIAASVKNKIKLKNEQNSI